MVQRRSKLAFACRQAREGLVDFTEGKLFECISEKREKSIIFALSTLGRHRGYALAKGTELSFGDWAELERIERLNDQGVPQLGALIIGAGTLFQAKPAPAVMPAPIPRLPKGLSDLTPQQRAGYGAP